MDGILLPGLAIVGVLVLVAILVTVLGIRYRRRHAGPRDLRRAGDGESDPATVEDATLSAGGKSAWMRIGGGI